MRTAEALSTHVENAVSNSHENVDDHRERYVVMGRAAFPRALVREEAAHTRASSTSRYTTLAFRRLMSVCDTSFELLVDHEEAHTRSHGLRALREIARGDRT